MKILYLVRHAKAVPHKANFPDFERALNKRGKKDARRISQATKGKGPLPQLLMTSPAKRAIQTTQIFAKTIGYPKNKIILDEFLYQAGGESPEVSLLERIHKFDDQYQSAMIVGHDPLLTEFSRYLKRDFTRALPTCGVVCFHFRNISWSNISKGRSSVQFFDFPDREKILFTELKEDLRSKITTQLTQIVTEANPQTAKKMKGAINKSARDLTQRFLAKLTVIENKKKAKSKRSAS